MCVIHPRAGVELHCARSSGRRARCYRLLPWQTVRLRRPVAPSRARVHMVLRGSRQRWCSCMSRKGARPRCGHAPSRARHALSPGRHRVTFCSPYRAGISSVVAARRHPPTGGIRRRPLEVGAPSATACAPRRRKRRHRQPRPRPASVEWAASASPPTATSRLGRRPWWRTTRTRSATASPRRSSTGYPTTGDRSSSGEISATAAFPAMWPSIWCCSCRADRPDPAGEGDTR